MIIILVVLILVVAVVALIIKIWLPLMPPPSEKTSILRGSPIIVKEIDCWFYKTVLVSLDDDSTDINSSDTSIEFYGVYDYCDGQHVLFPIKEEVVLTDKNISDYVPEYFALKGTFFEYEISGDSSRQRVKVCAYQGSSPGHGQCSTYLPWGQGSAFYKVPTPGYYFFRLVGESSEEITNYKLTIHENFKILTPNQGDILGCSINTTNKFCEFSLPLKHKYCLMAKLYQSTVVTSHVELDARVELDIQITESRLEVMLAIPLSLLVLVIMLVLLFLVCVPLCYLRFCINRQSKPI